MSAVPGATAAYYVGGLLLFLALLHRAPLLAILLLTGYTLTGKRHIPVSNAVRTLPRDLYMLVTLGKALLLLWICQKLNLSVFSFFGRHVRRRPKQVALMTNDVKMTFEEVEEESWKVCRWLRSAGVGKGDVVALLAEGRPQYVVVWLGAARLGAVTALINTNQRKAVLQHSLDAVQPKVLVYGTELAQAVIELEAERLSEYKLVRLGQGHDDLPAVSLQAELESVTAEPPRDLPTVGFNDKLLYIYTSGTTGLPKAAVITHARFMMMALGTSCGFGTTSKDTCYTSLPLYHSAGGILGTGQAIIAGATVFIRPKFSASNFWKDCVQYKCTMAQYIGEICRFLLSGPERPEESRHKLRVMFGNGLRPQIWTQFVERFNIPWVFEFYGATEGNGNLVNNWNRVGAVGFIPWFAVPLMPIKLLKVAPDSCEPVRGPDGLCVPANTGEPGLLVNIISKSGARQFHGYSDKEATKKKILRDVFKKGDSVFNSGDVLVTDELGYFYFRDRTGDTFRWKGENVSTSEVEAVISNIVGLKDAIVYGVEVPNCEGKAGMVAIVDEERKLNFEALEKGLKGSLSSYARPLFLRILEKTPMTATFKLQKVDLQKEAFDVEKIKDPVYFLDPKGHYLPLTQQLHSDIMKGVVRV